MMSLTHRNNLALTKTTDIFFLENRKLFRCIAIIAGLSPP